MCCISQLICCDNVLQRQVLAVSSVGLPGTRHWLRGKPLPSTPVTSDKWANSVTCLQITEHVTVARARGMAAAAAAASLAAAVVVVVVSSVTPVVAAFQGSSSSSVQPLPGSPWQRKPLEGSLGRKRKGGCNTHVQ